MQYLRLNKKQEALQLMSHPSATILEPSHIKCVKSEVCTKDGKQRGLKELGGKEEDKQG